MKANITARISSFVYLTYLPVHILFQVAVA